MKINLTIEVTTPEELREVCGAIVGEADKINTREEKIDATSYDPVSDPYGDGNGPVDEVRPIPQTNTPDAPNTLDAPNTSDADENGLPWDERIHAASKALNADGTWRKRRGVSDDLVSEVETELRGEPVALEGEECATYCEPELNACSYNLPDGSHVMTVIGSAMSSGKLQPANIAELCAAANIGALPEIMTNDEARQLVVEKLADYEVKV
jgi:hypothetical protein